MKVTTTSQAGLHFGAIDGKTVCGPYLNKGMATRQANRIKAQREAQAAPSAEEMAIEAARAEGRRMGMTEDQIERFIARMA